MFRKALIAVTIGCLAVATTACNTVKGLGNDIESVGQAGDRAMR
jgi:predicted small secreted protein